MSNSSGGDYNGITAPQQQPEADDNEDGPWNCPACTFLNENPLHLVCAVCGTAKVINKAPKIQTNPNDSFTGGTGSIGFPPPRDYDGFNRSGSMGSFTGGGPNSYNNRRRESNAEELMGSFSSRGGGRDRGDDYNYRGADNSQLRSAQETTDIALSWLEKQKSSSFFFTCWALWLFWALRAP